MKTIEEVCKVLEAVQDKADFWVRTYGDGEVHIEFNCNDYFYWGTADSEEFTAEDIPAFEQACIDSDGEYSEEDIWLCRKRGMRPQTCILKNIRPKARAIIEREFPFREVDILNGG